MRRRDRERGSALILVLLVVLVLLGLGLVAMRQTRTEMLTTGNRRVGQQAFQVANAGLVRASVTAMSSPDYFHRKAVQANPDAPSYTFGAEQTLSYPPGIFTLSNPLEGDEASQTTHDVDKIGVEEYTAVMTNPRLAQPPAGFQIAGGSGNRFIFYTYQFDVTGWINRAANLLVVDPGTGGGIRHLQADVRLGPIAVNQ